MVSLGHMAQLAPKATFVGKLKPIVQNVLVKGLLMEDQQQYKGNRRTSELWTADHMISEETQAKVRLSSHHQLTGTCYNHAIL